MTASQEPPAFAVKCAGIVGLVKVLRRDGMLESLRSGASSKALEFIDLPPPVSSWVPGEVMVELEAAVLKQYGPAVLRRTMRDSVKETTAPLLRSIVEGAMRLFGASPESLFKRIGSVSEGSTRGLTVEYTSQGPQQGRVHYRFTAGATMAEPVAIAFAGALEAIFDLVGVAGNVEGPRFVSPRYAVFDLRW